MKLTDHELLGDFDGTGSKPMIFRWLRFHPKGMLNGIVGFISLGKNRSNTEPGRSSGTIFNNRRPRLRISLVITVILGGLMGGLYLSVRVSQQDTSLLARVPRMITTPGGDTQRNSNQYQETVKLANQKNLASVENTSESYILIPEEVTETIRTEEITISLPWSGTDQTNLLDQNHESEMELGNDVQSRDNTRIANEKKITEELLAELNNTRNSEPSNMVSTSAEQVPSQKNKERAAQESSANFAPDLSQKGNSYQISNPENEISEKQSKYRLAVLNQMNAIANSLVVHAPETGFFTNRDEQKSSSSEPAKNFEPGSGNRENKQNQSNNNGVPDQRISAGSILYGEVIAEVSSDFSSPILVEITHGNYKGWRLVGQFNSVPSGKGLLVSFNRLVNLEGREFSVSALAIDGIEGQSLIASKVEPRLLQRYGPVFATSFISGLAESLAQPRATLGTIGNAQVLVEEPATLEQAGYAGLKNSFSALSSDIANYIPKGPLITIQSGHPVGILFTGSIVVLN